MAWIILLVAGLFEILWTYFMKASDGLSKVWPTAITFICMLISVVLLAQAMKSLPMGTAYMVWAGIGALGSFLVGILVLGEQATLMRMTAALLIGAGMVLMKLATTEA